MKKIIFLVTILINFAFSKDIGVFGPNGITYILYQDSNNMVVFQRCEDYQLIEYESDYKRECTVKHRYKRSKKDFVEIIQNKSVRIFEFLERQIQPVKDQTKKSIKLAQEQLKEQNKKLEYVKKFSPDEVEGINSEIKKIEEEIELLKVKEKQKIQEIRSSQEKFKKDYLTYKKILRYLSEKKITISSSPAKIEADIQDYLQNSCIHHKMRLPINATKMHYDVFVQQNSSRSHYPSWAGYTDPRSTGYRIASIDLELISMKGFNKDHNHLKFKGKYYFRYALGDNQVEAAKLFYKLLEENCDQVK